MKKKKEKQKLESSTSYLVVESRYIVLYRDGYGLGVPGGVTWPGGPVGVCNGMP